MADIGGLSIVASPSVILADGITYALLTATVTQPNGDPLQGVPVSFAATSGTLSETEVTTDEYGQASVRLVSSSVAGTALVAVTCPPLSSQTQVQFATEVTNVLVLLYASVLPADGQTSSLLTAQLMDTQGAPLVDQIVTFTSSLGTLSAAQGVTEEAGEVQVTLTTGQTGVARVTASGGGVTAEADVVFVSLERLQLNLEPSAIPADGASQTTIVVTLTDSTGAPVPNAVISLTTTLGSLSAAQVTTDADGQAAVSLTGGATAGIAEITATNGSLSSQVLVSVKPLVVTLSALPNILPADGGSTAEITAHVEDTSGNVVADGTPVTFQTHWGTFSGGTGQVQVTTTNGKATALLTAGATPPTGDTFEVSATCQAASQSIFLWTGTGTAPISVTVNHPAEGTTVSGAVIAISGVVNVDSTRISEGVDIDALKVYVGDVSVDTLTNLVDDGTGRFAWSTTLDGHNVASPSSHIVTAVAEYTLTDPATQTSRTGAAEDRNAFTLNNTPQVSQPRVYQGNVIVPEGGSIGGVVRVEVDATPADGDFISAVEFMAGGQTFGVALPDPALPVGTQQTFSVLWDTEEVNPDGTPRFPGGAYSLTARAEAGASHASSVATSVSVDHAPLSVNLSRPAIGEVVRGDMEVEAYVSVAAGASLPVVEMAISGSASGSVRLTWEPEYLVWVPDSSPEGGYWDTRYDETRYVGLWRTGTLDSAGNRLYPDGNYTLVARAQGFIGMQEATASTTVIAEGEAQLDSSPVAVTISNQSTLTGAVTHSDTGAALAGATVQVVSEVQVPSDGEPGAWDTLEHLAGETTTALDGTYQVSVPGGNYKVRAQKHGYSPCAQWVEATAGQSLAGVNFQLDPWTVLVESEKVMILSGDSASAAGYTQVVAQVMEHDEWGFKVCGVDGVTVNFSASLGEVTPITAVTDAEGKATTVLRSGASTGDALVSAQTEEAQGQTTVAIVAEIGS